MNRNTLALTAALVGLCLQRAETASGVVVYGPGPSSLIYETSDVDYHVLDGTEIVTASRTGPPEDMVIVTDAIEFRGGGHIRIDGGYFRGGDASYTGPNGELANVSGGEALHLRQSTGEVFGGTFIGGAATSSTRRGNTFGGDALVLVDSRIAIYGGYFEAGLGTGPDLVGEVVTRQALGALVSNSRIDLYGGEVHGEISLKQASSLYVYGTDLEYKNNLLTGRYRDGTPFSHTVTGSSVFLVDTVPEPGGLALAALACAGLASRRRGYRAC